MKKTFVVYSSWEPLFDNLSNDDAAMLIRTIYDYQIRGDEPDKSWSLYPTFLMLKNTIDEDNKKYQEKCDRLKNNSRNRTEIEPISSRNQNDIESKSERNQNDITLVASDTDSLSVSDDKDTELQGYFNDPDLNKSFNDYVSMRIKKNAPVDFVRVQRQLYDMAKGDVKTMVAMLEQSITQGWTGLFELPKPRGKPPDKNDKIHFDLERKYDFDELEKNILNRRKT